MIPTWTGIPRKIEGQIRDIYNGKVGEFYTKNWKALQFLCWKNEKQILEKFREITSQKGRNRENIQLYKNTRKWKKYWKIR